ncbi:SPI-1 type III secretion system needle tip complex protein SipB [Salmonella enterica]|uniref:SPI-1 type III secretion system needle tip complex protein SipB n=2 Tax=Salmonella enterica TaxID=28901 RepID=A0A5V1IRS1_SALER|nr:SPI-1 type III secretion system needle tip complex protein SipB [Salmonella enterica]EDX4410494.1 SPI-1 type III secretion system needle tip complex protein SipB [Salmonella enterica subsp. houtenae serovar 44:z36,[z38]:-]HAC6490677.1 SPI-1 type III secretion system needle tip complex protein SipB [Salmonella enterica subsp. houtenae serovar 44:z36[z38]:-]EAS2167768.1 SPI-1 type III secretion system needle tip complex protein SipB [Salmonella enterica]EAY1799589.1 SPI-1 type III secretion sy
MVNDASSISRSGYTQNPRLAEAAFEGVRKNTDFLKAADKAFKDVVATKAGDLKAGTKSGETTMNTVGLTPPTDAAREKLTSEGQLTLLLGKLMTLLGDVSLSQLESRLAVWQAMIESQKAMGIQVSKEFQTALGEAEKATDLYDESIKKTDTAKSTYDAAAKKLTLAQNKLQSLDPSDPGYAQAEAAVEQAGKEATEAKDKLDKATDAAIKACTDAKVKAEKADNILTKFQGTTNVVASQSDVAKGEKDNLSNVARLTMLMAMFIEIVGKNNEEGLQNDLALFNALQEGRQAEMEKKSAEFQEETRKAEETNRIMGCIGKVLGALLTIVSVVAAVFTGGASLALAAVGLAVMVADEIVKAATGVSFIQQALNPIMEHVLKPLMELIGKAITKALEGLGVDKKTAEMAGSIVGAIVAAIAMVVVIVVVAVVGKGAAAKLGSALSKMMGETIKKLVPNVLKQLAQNGSKLFTQGMQRITSGLGNVGSKMGLQTNALSKELVGNTLNKVALGIEVTNTAAQSAGGVAEGVFIKNASEALADFTLARFAMDQIQQWLKQSVEIFGENQKVTAELQKVMYSAVQQNADASRFILRQSRA